LEQIHNTSYCSALTSILSSGGAPSGQDSRRGADQQLAIEDGQADSIVVVEEFETFEKLREAKTGKVVLQGSCCS
jgi:hypothetical protein